MQAEIRVSICNSRAAGRRQKLGEAWDGFSPRVLRGGTRPAHTWILDFGLQTVREHISVVLSDRVCGHLLWQP